MEIVEISQNDDLITIARKCNLNFKQMAWSSSQATKRQSRIDSGETTAAIEQLIEQLQVDIPNEVAAQISNLDVPGMVSTAVTTQITNADIPGTVATEVGNQIQTAYPPVGAYLMCGHDPSNDYDGTTWQLFDTITTDTSQSISVWNRTL